MRVVVKEYAGGGRGAFETSNDGGVTVGEWSGPRQVGERICGFVEAACDDTPEGVERLLETLDWLREEIPAPQGPARRRVTPEVAMVNLITDAEQVAVPAWVVDLESFRRWVDARDVPEKARVWYLAGEVWVDMSKEQIFSHVLVKSKVCASLTALVESAQLGLYLGDGARLSNVEADFSVKPDGVYIANATLESGRVRLVEGMEEGFLELEGTPDMVLEVVSRASVRKDKVQLRRAYWEAGVREYWLVDARKVPLSFEILRHAARGYVAARKQQGWARSAVFGRMFRFLQKEGALGHPDYVLEAD